MLLSIDPGSSGAAVLRSETGEVAAIVDYEGPESITEAINSGPITRAVIERVWASPVMGVSAAYAFGENYGAWCGAITLKGIPLTRVLPLDDEAKLKTLFAAEGGKIALQILHTGRYGYHPFAVAPSKIKSPISPFAPHELSARGVERHIRHRRRLQPGVRRPASPLLWHRC